MLKDLREAENGQSKINMERFNPSDWQSGQLLSSEHLTHQEEDLAQFRRFTIAHNAAMDPKKLQRSLSSNVSYIEVDLTIVDGHPVVAHSPESYLQLSDQEKRGQNLSEIIERIQRGGKEILWDFKDQIIKPDQLRDALDFLKNNSTSIASSNNHQLLDGLRKKGFGGTLLYSIEYESTLSSFLRMNYNADLSSKNAGVSIQYTLLDEQTSTLLQKMGAKIAAWNPTNATDIANSALSGADFITSDNLELLSQIEKPFDLNMSSSD